MMSKNDVLDNPAFVEAAFSEPVLAGNNSTVITLLPDQKVAVVHIAEHQPEHPMPLDQVKSKIEQVLRREAANKKMAEDVQKWLVDLNSKETLADLAKSMQLNVNQILVGRFEFMKYDPQLLRTVFAMPRPTDTSRSINATALSSGDYAVIQLNKVIDGEPTSEEKAMFDAYARNLTQIKAQLDYDLYLKGLYDHAKIKYFEK